MQLRTAQITDIQQKCMDGNEDIANKKRWESVPSMVEAKVAMNYLFDVATEHKVLTSGQQDEISDLQVRVGSDLLYSAVVR